MPRRDDYTTEELERGLLMVALNGGKCTAAARMLAKQGNPIPKTTLQYWRDRHAERYAELREREVARIHARIASLAEDTAADAVRVTQTAVEETERLIGVGDLKEASVAAATARNLATVYGISVDKVRPLRDMPDHTVEHRTADEALRRLEALAGTVEGTAIEVPASQLPTGDPE